MLFAVGLRLTNQQADRPLIECEPPLIKYNYLFTQYWLLEPCVCACVGMLYLVYVPASLYVCVFISFSTGWLASGGFGSFWLQCSVYSVSFSQEQVGREGTVSHGPARPARTLWNAHIYLPTSGPARLAMKLVGGARWKIKPLERDCPNHTRPTETHVPC